MVAFSFTDSSDPLPGEDSTTAGSFGTITDYQKEPFNLGVSAQSPVGSSLELSRDDVPELKVLSLHEDNLLPFSTTSYSPSQELEDSLVSRASGPESELEDSLVSRASGLKKFLGFGRNRRPFVFAKLANDTDLDGGTKYDRITSDSSIKGRVFDLDGEVERLTISVDSRRRRDFVDVSDALGENGKFFLDRADLEEANNAPLADGDHTVYIRAYDDESRASRVKKVKFELNRVLYAISNEDPRELALVNMETDDLVLAKLDDIDGWTEVEEQLRSTELRYFEGTLTPDQVVVPEGLPDPVAEGLEAGGTIKLVLDPTGAVFGKEGPAVKYDIELFGVDLGGTSTPETGDDITAMHLHSGLVGEQLIGVHTLNIFGMPSVDDNDAVFNLNENTISGIWDNLDSTDDVNTGNTSNGVPDHHQSDPIDGINPISSKTVTDFADELLADSFYIQVHTNDYPIPTGALRAQISEVEGDGSYEASNEGFLEKAFIEHVLVTPDEKRIYATVNGSLQIANAIVAIDVENIDWKSREAQLSVANTIKVAEAGEPSVYPEGLAQVDDSQPIQTWPTQAWNQVHGPNIQPGSSIISFTQWTNDKIFFIDDNTQELIETLVIPGVTDQAHGLTFNPSGTIGLAPDYFYGASNVDYYSVDPLTKKSNYEESIKITSEEGNGPFQHFVSWVDDRYAYVASMQYGPTSLDGDEPVATPGFWLIDAFNRTAERVIGTAETADDPGVFRNPSDYIVVGDKLYVAEEDSLDDTFGDDGYVAVYNVSDPYNPEFIKRLKPGDGLPADFQIAHGLSPAPDGSAVYVASYRSNYLLKIDTETDTVAKTYGEADGLLSTHGGFAAGAYR